MPDTKHTAMVRVRREALAIVRALGEQHPTATDSDIRTALIRLGARHTAEEIAAELAAMGPSGWGGPRLPEKVRGDP